MNFMFYLYYLLSILMHLSIFFSDKVHYFELIYILRKKLSIFPYTDVNDRMSNIVSIIFIIYKKIVFCRFSHGFLTPVFTSYSFTGILTRLIIMKIWKMPAFSYLISDTILVGNNAQYCNRATPIILLRWNFWSTFHRTKY